MIRRLLDELRRGHSSAEVDRALAAVVVTVESGAASLSRGIGQPMLATRITAETARLEPGVYAKTPTSAARTELLARAASIAHRVEVNVPIASEGTHRGRLLIDLPRRAAALVGISSAEPGDRFATEFVHAFFDDEALIAEAQHAGLAYVARRGAWIVFERSTASSAERAPTFSRELARALRMARQAELRRRTDTPERAIAAMRERGREGEERRGPIGRARLRRAIGWVDSGFPGGPNCFRRTLIELALDAGAAGETLVFGLDVGKTGHVAFKDAEDRTFDVAFEVPP